MPTLELADWTLFYEDSGAGSGVLLLHGLGSSTHDWDEVVPLLAPRRRVIVPDIRGHGRSGKPLGSYSVPLFADDIARMCDRLGLSRVHVVGLSMGGMIAFQLAVSRPDLVRSLVILNSGPDMVPRTWKLKLGFGSRLLFARWFGPKWLADKLAPRLFPGPDQEALRQKTRDLLGNNDHSAYYRATRALVGWTVLPALDRVTCPVLVLASDRDYTPVAAKEAYARKLKDARVEVITDSGHAAPWDQPKKVAAAVEAFISDVERRESSAAAS